MHRRAFTLIELLVVISIISLLVSVVLSSLNSARARARDARRKMDVHTIQIALQKYYSEHGNYPPYGWIFSSRNNWRSSLSATLGVDLPVDPINELTYPYNGGSSYAYYASTGYAGCAAGSWYILVYHMESYTVTSSENAGVTRCSTGTKLKFGNNSISVGDSPAQ